MKNIRIMKFSCLFLSALLLLQSAVLPAGATELQATEQALPACTTALETTPEQTEPMPAETVEETVESLIVPQATIVKELVSMEVVRREPARPWRQLPARPPARPVP